MLKFVDSLYSDKSGAGHERESNVRRRELKRTDSSDRKRNSLFSSRADGLLFLPGDHIPPKAPGSEGSSETTASRRSSMSFADSRNSSERSESRASSIKGRTFFRSSRKSAQVKPPVSFQSTDTLPMTTSPLVAVDSFDAGSLGAVDNDASQAPDRRRLISQPFDFLHVKHTHRSHLTDVHRLSQYELVSEFAAATEGQKPTKELNGISVRDIRNNARASDVPQSQFDKHVLQEQAGKVIPPRPRRSDELLAGTASVQPETNVELRHVRSAEVVEQLPSISQIAARSAPARRTMVDGPAIRNLGGLGARQPTGAPQLLLSQAAETPADARWNLFAANGFSDTPASAPETPQEPHMPSTPQPPLLSAFTDDSVLSPSYGKELERVDEEDEESKSQRASKALQSLESSPASPNTTRPALPSKSASRTSKLIAPVEPIRRSLQSPRQPVSRVNSNASDTLGGFIHRPLTARKSTSSFLSTATGRSRGAKRGTDSVNWEDEIDFAYEHHMEAHCDLDWANSSKRETSTSVETVPELDHSNSSSVRSTQDGSLLPPSSMGIDILATVNEALSSPDLSGAEEKLTRRKPHIRDSSREDFLYDDGRPDLGLSPTSPSTDLDEAKMTMSATTVSGSEVTTPADVGDTFKFTARRQYDTDSLPSPVEEKDMYADVLASYEKATRPSLDAVVEASSSDEAPQVPRRHNFLKIAESRPFQRASLLTPSRPHPAKHQKSASTGMVTDFAVATLRARLQHEASQPEDDGVTPRQSSRLSASNLKLHTMVSQLRNDVSSPSTPGSELTDDPASLSSSQVSFTPAEGMSSVAAPSSTASDDIYQAILPPIATEAPPIPQRSRSRLHRGSMVVTTPMTSPTMEEPTAPAHRKLHSAGSNQHGSPPPSHVAYFSPRSESQGALSPMLSPVMTIASEAPSSPVSPIESKALPPLPSPPFVRSRSINRRPSETSNMTGMASLGVPSSNVRPASKGSVMTAIHSPTIGDRPPSRSANVKVEKPGHRRTSSRTSISSTKYKTVRHYTFGFDVVDDDDMLPKPAPKSKPQRPITQFNLPSQEILALGSGSKRPTTAGGEFVAKQYSDMSSDQPAPMFVTHTPQKNSAFSLFPLPPTGKPKKIKNPMEGSRFDRVLTALQ